MDEIRGQENQIRSKVKLKEKLSEEIESQYFRSLLPSLIHMLLTIPGYDDALKIAEHLKIDTSKVQKTLEFLCENGFVRKEFNRYIVEKQFLHIDATSQYINQYHKNVRLKSIEMLENSAKDSHRYSLMFTCAKSDFETIREIINNSLSKIADVIKPSPEEALYCFCSDVFQIS